MMSLVTNEIISLNNILTTKYTQKQMKSCYTTTRLELVVKTKKRAHAHRTNDSSQTIRHLRP